MITFYTANKPAVWLLAISLTCIVCLLHYVTFGPRQANKQDPAALVKRFVLWELLAHWMRVVCFIILAATGLMLIQGMRSGGEIHEGMGNLFFIVSLIVFAAGFRDTLFKGYDWVWLKNFGGYLSRTDPSLPAGRFNAGQKLYNWTTIILILALFISAKALEGNPDPLVAAIHGMIACLTTVAVIGHAYLAVFANPASAPVLMNGKMSKTQVGQDHPLWDFSSRIDA